MRSIVNQPETTEERWEEIKESSDNADKITSDRWGGEKVPSSFVEYTERRINKGELTESGTIWKGWSADEGEVIKGTKVISSNDDSSTHITANIYGRADEVQGELNISSASWSGLHYTSGEEHVSFDDPNFKDKVNEEWVKDLQEEYQAQQEQPPKDEFNPNATPFYPKK